MQSVVFTMSCQLNAKHGVKAEMKFAKKNKIKCFYYLNINFNVTNSTRFTFNENNLLGVKVYN